MPPPAPVFDANVAAASTTKAFTLDLRPYLCSAGTCATNRGNDWPHKDGSHLTTQESSRLGPVFADAVRPLVSPL